MQLANELPVVIQSGKGGALLLGAEVFYGSLRRWRMTSKLGVIQSSLC